MNVALLTEKYPPDAGGLAVSSERLARLLASAGHTVYVFAPTGDLPPAQSACIEQDSLAIHRLGAHKRVGDTLADWFRLLASRHAGHPFDVLHAYYITQAGFVAVYAGRTIGVPSIVSARGNDLDRAVFDADRAAHTLYALQHADAITANSHDLVRKARALSGRDTILIHSGVDSDHFTPAALDASLKRSLGLGDLPVVGFVGEARAKKGLAVLLVAFREVAHTRQAALLLAGGVRSDDMDTLKVFQKQNPNLPIAVVPYRSGDALPACYNLIDVLVLPSLWDSLPNALLEGMACQRAIVATSVGGIPDAIRDGENGRLVPPGDATALAAVICELLDDAELRRRLGSAARTTVVQHFTPTQELERNLAVYRRLKPAP